MVQPISREEELQRSGDDVFAERQKELEDMADKMPKRIVGDFPYLMEKNTGVVHPYSDAMAERSDLVIGCYNLQGSRNPEDVDPDYDPRGMRMRNERVHRVQSVGPQNAAERKAAAAEELGRIRREEREKAAAEFDARMEAERERIRAEILAEQQSGLDVPEEKKVKPAAAKKARGKATKVPSPPPAAIVDTQEPLVPQEPALEPEEVPSVTDDNPVETLAAAMNAAMSE